MAVGGWGKEGRGGSKDESEIIIVSGDALMHGKMSFPGLGCNCITRLYNKVVLLLWILANDCCFFQAVERYFINTYLYPTHYCFLFSI